MKTLAFLLPLAVYAATPVQILDTVRSPVNYRPYNGVITITVKDPLTCGTESFVKDVASIKVVAGAVNLTLMPNDSCTPTGTQYYVRYEPPLGPTTVERWLVPSSGSALTIAQVRTSVVATTPITPIALALLASGGATTNQALCWNGTAWAPGSCGGGGGGTTAATWGSITGTLAEQGDLYSAIGLKQNEITPATDLSMRDLTAKSAQFGDGVADGKMEICTADGLSCQTFPAPYASGSEPTCDATKRGYRVFVLGGTGVSDLTKECEKQSDGTYAWVTQSIAGGTAEWGGITGSLSAQADLTAALAGKQDALTTGGSSQYIRGDLSLATFPTIPTITGSTILKGSSGNAVAASAADIVSLWSGTPSTSLFLRSDGTLAAAPGPAWGSISGTLSSQADLVLALAGKQSTITGAPGTWPSSFAPSAHASSHKNGGSDEVATATPAANAIPKAGAGGTLNAGWIPTLNQNTTGTAANLSGTPALPNGTTATTQSASDNSTKLATTAYVDRSAIASGTAVLGTSAIAANSCATAVTVSASGVATTDVIVFTPNADVSSVTGYGAGLADGLAIYPYPTANNVNFKVCNKTGSSITPGAVTLNWRVRR